MRQVKQTPQGALKTVAFVFHISCTGKIDQILSKIQQLIAINEKIGKICLDTKSEDPMSTHSNNCSIQFEDGKGEILTCVRGRRFQHFN